jgi:hypothetical protein
VFNKYGRASSACPDEEMECAKIKTAVGRNRIPKNALLFME